MNARGQQSDVPRSSTSVISRVLTWPLIGGIYLYRFTLAPLIGGQCRFTPTCSQYALDALRLRGPFVGSWLTLRRLARCHPFCQGGYDPVPHPPESRPPNPDTGTKVCKH